MLTFLELAEKILNENKIPLTSKEIWELGKKGGYNNQRKNTLAHLICKIIRCHQR